MTKIQIASPAVGEEEIQAIAATVESGWLTQGPKVEEFERSFAERHSTRFAMAVSSCTSGLHLALLACGVGPGDEVIVPSFTWVATANVVVQCGAVPVFVDVDPLTFNIDPDRVLEKVGSRTKAVIAVHLFGLCADMGRLRELLPKDVRLIEDAACAAGAEHHGVPAGGLGDIGVFSFHPRKTITTGEGGMVTTHDPILAHKVQAMRNHGASVSEEIRHRGPQPYLLPDFDVLGFNYRMTDLQGALGLVQLQKLDHFVNERAKWAAWYKERLSGLPWLRLPEEPQGARHGWQAYVTMVDESRAPLTRNEIMFMMEEKGIATRPGTHAVHMLGLYRRDFGLSPDDFPVSRDCDSFSMALPLHNRMTEDDYMRVAESLLSLDR